MYIGPPGLEARHEILRSCYEELRRVGIVGRASAACSLFSALPTDTMCSQSMESDVSGTCPPLCKCLQMILILVTSKLIYSGSKVLRFGVEKMCEVRCGVVMGWGGVCV